MTSSWKYLCATLWVIGISVNTPLNVGIISYEKYGMDPCKRNLTDQVRQFRRFYAARSIVIGSKVFSLVINTIFIVRCSQ